MKRKKRVGIPRNPIYYRDGVLLKHFLINLNCKIISNKEKELTIRDKICYPYQIYINDINVLSEICDYILIPEIYNYGINNNVCPYLKEILTDKMTKRQILRYKIKYTSLIFEITSLFIIGLKLTKNIIKIIYSYIYAKRKQINYNNNQENYQRHLIDKEQKKILIMSYFYILEDIKEEIISILKKYNIILLFSNYLNKKEAYKFSQYYKEELGNIYVKEMVGAYYYYQYIVSGVIYISPNNCEIDNILNSTSVFNNDVPLLKIKHNNIDHNIIDEFIKKLI